ncbi:MAG: hypothetical protein OXF05_01260, partial [Hyphomicrobiales bacterium]|nr:hypothetical protein [Hyphomicrobiales bacterium]
TEGTTGHPVAVVLNFDPPADGLEVMATATGDHAADVSIPSPVLNFTGTTRELPVLVDVLTDTQEEGAEIVLLELGETAAPLPAGWTLLASGDNDHDLTILPNGQTAMFVEAGWTADEGDGTISFQVELSADAPAGGIPLEAAITSGNENNDVTFTTQSFVIIEGERQHTLTVDINDDTLVEPDETVTFTLSKDASAVFPDAWGDLGTPTTFELTITNNDSATVGFAAAASTLLEGDTTAVLTVSMSNPVSQDVEVTLSESGDVNGDLAFSPAAMTFAPGETSKEVTLTVNAANNDTTPEGDVAITYTLAGTFPDNVSFAAGEHVVTFADDDRTISFRDASSSASEGTTGHPVAVVLNFDPPAGGLEVAATATGDHAADVSIPSPTLNFTGTTRELPVLVNVLEDAVQEDAEIVLLELGETAALLPAGWTLLASGDNDHDLTILPSDQTAMFAQAGRTADEGDGTISFLVELSADAPSGGVPLEAAITSGNDDGDVTFTTQSFVIVEGAREHTLTVDINDDALPESDETVVFTLSKDSSAVFPDAWGDLGAQTTFDLVITDNDEVSSGATANNIVVPDDKTIRFKDSSSSAIEGTTGHPVAVVLNFDPPAGGLEVAAAAKGDHKDDVSIPSPVLNFTGGTRELPVLVDVLNDIEQEDAEVVQLELEATALPADWTLVASGENDHDLTIEANDRTAEFADAGRAVDENAGTVSFRVILSADAPADGVPLEAAITSGNENGDVTFATQSFTIAEGGREHTLTVDINEDNQVEPDEVVRFTLSKGGSFPQTWGDLGAQTVFDLTIRASDGSIEFAGRETFAEENSGEAMIALDVQSVPPADGLPMRVEIAGHGRHAETATADDYAFDPLAFTLMPAGAGEGYNLAFPIIDDDLPEKDETFILTLHAGEGFPVGWGELGGQTTHYLTILPNDNTIGFADTLPAEMKEGTSDFPLEVVWNADIENIKDEPVSIRLGVELEKAAGGGTDPDEPDVLLEVQSINRTFNEFQDTSHDSWSYTGSAGSDRRIEMNVNDDALVEEDEEIVVRLVPIQGYSLPAGWSIDSAEYRFTIPVNDKTVGFAAADSSLVENDGDERGEVSGNVKVKLREPAPVGGLNLVVSVDEETNDDGGNIDAEVTIGEGGVVFISEGATEISFPVTVLEDDIAESNEPVVLTLSKGANWPELWEIGGIADTGNLSGTHTVTILGNDKKVGFRDAVRKLVSEANYASVSPVVTNYPAPVGGLDLTVNVESHTGSYARADVRTDGSGDLSYRENVRIRPNSRFEGVNTVAPVDDGIAEPDEAAVFRLSVAGGGQLPPGWEWSNQDLEVIILANDNDFTFQDDQNRSAGSYSEGTTVRLTAVATNPLPPLESEEYYANFRTRVGYFGIEVTENSEDISITPVAPVIYHPDYHHPDGSRKGLSQPIKGGQEFFADYAFTVTEGGQLESVSFDVAIHEDSKTEPPETVVITLSISGSWGLRPTTRQYTLTINDEGGTGMIGFREGEMPYGLYEKASLSTQRPGVLVELSSPSPAGGIDLVMRSSDPGQLLVGGNIHVPENRKGCYVTQLPVSTGSNYHFPEHRERCRFTDFNTISDGIPEGDETYEIIISEDPARPLPPKWSIDSERSRREVTIYSSDNKVGIAGFVDPDSGSIPENGTIPIEMIKKSVSLDEDEGLARLVLNVPNDPVPGGLRLRLKVTPDATTPGASVADFDNIYRDNDFTIPRRNQAGPFQHVIEIPITDDTDAEQRESFSFALQFQYASGNHNTWGNVDWGNNSATLTILQNDPGTIGFSSAANEESIAEGSPHNVTIELSHPVPVPVLLDITVEESDGDGEADVGTSQTMLAFPANATEMPFSLNVIDDDLVEGEEEIVLRLQSGENFPNDMVTIAQETHTFTILGSDNIIEFKEPKSIQVGEGDGTLNFTLTLTNPAPEGGLPMRLEILTGNDFYATADDFTLAEFDAPFTITPEDGLEYTFSITITGNDGPESAERIYLFPVKAEGFPDGWGMVVEESYRISILKNDS